MARLGFERRSDSSDIFLVFVNDCPGGKQGLFTTGIGKIKSLFLDSLDSLAYNSSSKNKLKIDLATSDKLKDETKWHMYKYHITVGSCHIKQF